MNEYQEIFNRLFEIYLETPIEGSFQVRSDLDKMKELVNKETSKKIKLELEDEYCDFIILSVYCPTCKKYLIKYDTRNEIEINYCRHCGQKLDCEEESNV